ncbi:hypothetical protein OESDEN_06178 [Oesophagostomum dentatum]|uniref:Uncharacterized protein n=1 Tax=Oesophagostomum dentatum TaxID=61180 RepID=A0A0B1TDI1_OESDE|nr:hypothetical protein OESDEN_06178 [Oesophagostomum dentatum]
MYMSVREQEKKKEGQVISLKIDVDARATPAERSKTGELAVEEKHHLEELESLRLARMNAEVEYVSIKKVGNDSDDELTCEKLEDENEEELNDLIDEHDAGETRGPYSGVQEESDKEKEEGTDNESVKEDSEDEQEESECGGEEEEDERITENDHMPEPLKTKKTEGGLPIMAEEDLQIPFIFEMPTNYDALVELLEKNILHKKSKWS